MEAKAVGQLAAVVVILHRLCVQSVPSATQIGRSAPGFSIGATLDGIRVRHALRHCPDRP